MIDPLPMALNVIEDIEDLDIDTSSPRAVLFYGYSGSGKTYSTRRLLSSAGIAGGMPKFSCFEIYNQKKKMIVVDGKLDEQTLDYIDKTRAAHETKLNKRSSRSHLIYTIHGGLIVVDLAGCENTEKSGVKGKNLREACSINSSLHVLQKCIRAIADGDSYVPYRESLLTMTLADYLCKESILICTIASLKEFEKIKPFADRCADVQKINLLSEISRLEKEIEAIETTVTKHGRRKGSSST